MKYIFSILFILLNLNSVAFSAVVRSTFSPNALSAGTGGSGPPPVSVDFDFQHGVLKIEKEISEILEVPADQYSKYVLDSALGKPLTIEGKTHTTDLMDLPNGRIILKPTTANDKRVLLQRIETKTGEGTIP